MRRARSPDGPDDQLVAAGLGVAALGPIVVASLLVLVRDHIARSNAALVFVVVVVIAAALGGRWTGVVAAVVSAMSYDFFLTRPYGSLKIDQAEDIVATVLLLAVGLIVGEVVVWAHRGHRQSKRGRDEITRLHRVAEQVAAGAGADAVLASVCAELNELLSLRDARFEQAPFGAPLPRLQRNGSIDTPRRRFMHGEFTLPKEGVELPVLGRGRLLGRLVLEPEPDVGVSIEERMVAIAISDQLGAALAAELDAPKPNGERENDPFLS
ncbi:MAG TPA: DUF4118 domain-containing protein [Acidimicrobiia bacterium]